MGNQLNSKLQDEKLKERVVYRLPRYPTQESRNSQSFSRSDMWFSQKFDDLKQELTLAQKETQQAMIVSVNQDAELCIQCSSVPWTHLLVWEHKFCDWCLFTILKMDMETHWQCPRWYQKLPYWQCKKLSKKLELRFETIQEDAMITPMNLSDEVVDDSRVPQDDSSKNGEPKSTDGDTVIKKAAHMAQCTFLYETQRKPTPGMLIPAKVQMPSKPHCDTPPQNGSMCSGESNESGHNLRDRLRQYDNWSVFAQKSTNPIRAWDKPNKIELSEHNSEEEIIYQEPIDESSLIIIGDKAPLQGILTPIKPKVHLNSSSPFPNAESLFQSVDLSGSLQQTSFKLEENLSVLQKKRITRLSVSSPEQHRDSVDISLSESLEPAPSEPIVFEIESDPSVIEVTEHTNQSPIVPVEELEQDVESWESDEQLPSEINIELDIETKLGLWSTKPVQSKSPYALYKSPRKSKSLELEIETDVTKLELHRPNVLSEVSPVIESTQEVQDYTMPEKTVVKSSVTTNDKELESPQQNQTPKDTQWKSPRDYSAIIVKLLERHVSSEAIGQYLQYIQTGRLSQQSSKGINITSTSEIYAGEMENEKFHGYGTYFYSNGDVYQGQWVDGQKEGLGDYTSQFGGSYNGLWEKDLFHGLGKLKTNDGQQYSGEFFEGLRHGRGQQKESDGSIYAGSFYEDMKHGPGTQRYLCGELFKGKWVKGSRHGQGVYMFPSGEIRFVVYFKDRLKTTLKTVHSSQSNK